MQTRLKRLPILVVHELAVKLKLLAVLGQSPKVTELKAAAAQLRTCKQFLGGARKLSKSRQPPSNLF